MTFSDAVEIIFEMEGGYSANPSDPGGETQWGISKRNYPDIDIKALTKDTARQIYLHDYWNYCQCDNLPHGVDLMVFDMAVNQGPPTAVMLLQRTVGAKADGIVGTETIRRANQMENFLQEFSAQRFMHYAANPLFIRENIGLGWTRRLTKILILAARESK
jgi:lysozyme family protein